MKLALYVTALCMSVAAISVVALPLVMNGRHQSRGSANLALLGILVVFGLGIALYAVIGSPDVESHAATNVTARPSIASAPVELKGDKAGSVASLLTGLEARLAQEPDDAKGWLLLAQSYNLLGRADDAKNAYDKATSLGLSDEKLAARLHSVPEASSNSAVISGRVSIDSTVADRLEPDAVVYIIAKTGDSPMPLAVLRRSAGDLPFDFVLSDANSMVQGSGLSTTNKLTVEVRVSNSGDALAEDEGLGATLHGIDPRKSEALNIIIRLSGAQ